LQDPPKPKGDFINNYEWQVAPLRVKQFIKNQEWLIGQQQEQIKELKAQNDWLKEQLELNPQDKSSRRQPPTVSIPEAILWTLIGLLFTVAGTLVPAYSLTAPWHWHQTDNIIRPMGVTFQIGAVLLTGCLGGKYAGLLSQIAYIVIGLVWLPIFTQGGGLNYYQEPTFGYVIGFMFGAFICGWFAFQNCARLHYLALSCFAGLMTIHLSGIIYLVVLHLFGITHDLSLMQAINTYTLQPLPQQLILVCAVALIAYGLRKLNFS
jgi:biotin transport system substrate-specific component